MAVDTIKEAFEHYILKVPIVNEKLHYLEDKLGISRATILKAFYLILMVNLILGCGSRLLSNVLGFIYPAYKSIKAIEDQDTEKTRRWLIYWVVFTIFHVLEMFADILLSNWMLYDVSKAGFLLLCMTEKYQFLSSIYTTLIGPIVISQIEQVEGQIEQLRQDSDINVFVNRLESSLNRAAESSRLPDSPRLTAPDVQSSAQSSTQSGITDSGSGLRKRVLTQSVASSDFDQDSDVISLTKRSINVSENTTESSSDGDHSTVVSTNRMMSVD